MPEFPPGGERYISWFPTLLPIAREGKLVPAGYSTRDAPREGASLWTAEQEAYGLLLNGFQHRCQGHGARGARDEEWTRISWFSCFAVR
jgi:hypothetical protein